jgi:uncharacterized protein (DUF2336 family)
MGMAQIQPLVDGTEKLLEVVRGMPPERRRTLSVELAPRSDAPHRLMRYLAQDEIVIAEPVILESPVLTEDDLLAIAKYGSPAHVAKLRMRAQLPEPVRILLDKHNPKEVKLLEELRSRNMHSFRATLSEIVGVECDSALVSLECGHGASLAKLCKQAGLSRATYSAIVLLMDTARAHEITEALLFAYEAEQDLTQNCETNRAA